LYSLKEFQRASNIFLELIEKYPKSEFISLAKERVEKIESELAHMREANGKTPNP
jgi:outer membrane protein assembly factor BamD (BamD/ComL family)